METFLTAVTKKKAEPPQGLTVLPVLEKHEHEGACGDGCGCGDGGCC
ncbi:MAG TPA: hypothetical protein VJ397_09750 [Thermoplasmata archaeon]|nr:hypothetical protein [Thermoplasmata archaeon]